MADRDPTSERLYTDWRLVVGRSALHGWGVLTAGPLPERQVVEECAFELADDAALAQAAPALADRALSGKQRYPGKALLPSGGGMLYNHSAQPTCGCVLAMRGARPVLCFYTLRALAAGEELTIDYGADHWRRVQAREEAAGGPDPDLLAVARAQGRAAGEGGVQFYPAGQAPPRALRLRTAWEARAHQLQRLGRQLEHKEEVLARLRSRRLQLISEAASGAGYSNVTHKSYRDGPFGHLPASWRRARLADLTLSLHGGHYPASAGRSGADHGTLLLGRYNLDYDGLNLSRVRRLEPGAEGAPLSWLLAPGDILYAQAGNAVLLRHQAGPLCLDQDLWLVRPDPTAVDPEYLAYALCSQHSREQWRHQRDLRASELLLALPPGLDEQRALAAQIGAGLFRLQPLLARIRHELGALRERRQALADLAPS